MSAFEEPKYFSKQFDYEELKREISRGAFGELKFETAGGANDVLNIGGEQMLWRTNEYSVGGLFTDNPYSPRQLPILIMYSSVVFAGSHKPYRL